MTEKKKGKHKVLKLLLSTVAAIVVVFAAVFFIYVSNYMHSGQDAKAALESAKVAVTKFNQGVSFGNPDADTGYIFYPGGKVEYTAYAPIMESVAEGNVFCIIKKMPFNLAVFDISAASDIIKKYPNVKHWYIGGHSLGGAMAAILAAQQPKLFDGVILLAAYPTKDLSNSGLRVLTLYGSEDKVLKMDSLEKGRTLMPVDYKEICINGGNHGQFGDYGLQAGDGTAQITPSEQWKETTEAILSFIN